MQWSDVVNEKDVKVALVTGAARRIGAAIAAHLHERGWHLLLHCRQSVTVAESLCERFNQARGGTAHVLVANLAETGAAARLIDQAEGCWGRLDALINNASVFFPTPLGTLQPSDWQVVMQPNLEAPFFLSQAAWPMLKRAGGSIVNVTDIYAEYPLKDHPIYSTSKAGLLALTRSLALEMAPEVRVNAVSPGAILWPENQSDTEGCERILEKIPMARAGAPSDIGKAVHFFLDEAPYVTGQVLAVDGGRTICV